MQHCVCANATKDDASRYSFPFLRFFGVEYAAPVAPSSTLRPVFPSVSLRSHFHIALFSFFWFMVCMTLRLMRLCFLSLIFFHVVLLRFVFAFVSVIIVLFSMHLNACVIHVVSIGWRQHILHARINNTHAERLHRLCWTDRKSEVLLTQRMSRILNYYFWFCFRFGWFLHPTTIEEERAHGKFCHIFFCEHTSNRFSQHSCSLLRIKSNRVESKRWVCSWCAIEESLSFSKVHDPCRYFASCVLLFSITSQLAISINVWIGRAQEFALCKFWFMNSFAIWQSFGVRKTFDWWQRGRTKKNKENINSSVVFFFCAGKKNHREQKSVKEKPNRKCWWITIWSGSLHWP